jgi:hypothetical protein
VKTITTIAILVFALTTTSAWAQSAKPKTTAKKKPATMTESQRRDLEQRIETLERKYEMQYRETESPTGSPGAAGAAPAAAKPAAQ